MNRTRNTIKDNLLESRLFMGRSLIALLLFGAMVVALVARLVWLQVVAHEHFTTLSEDNRVKLNPVPPNRGLIYDRNGVLLAENLSSFRLEVIPEQIEDMDATLAELGALIEITDYDRERFEKLRRRMSRFEGVPLRFHLSEEEVARFAINRHRFEGVDIQAGLSRYYPLGSHAAHALGYVGRINEEELQVIDQTNYRGTTHIGKEGIEKAYEDTLHGKVGYEQLETNAGGRTLRVLTREAPVSGSSLYLSLDARLQQIIEQAFGEFSGSAVAIDPRNGEVLAFVSVPGYDPNPFVNGIDAKDYRALNENPDQPLFNRALRGQYPPGSTLKPFVALAGLETGVTNTQSSTFCPGFYRLPGGEHKYRCWKHGGHGTVNLNPAIVQSCDVYFYDLARSLGIDRLHDYLAQFSLGARTGIDLVRRAPRPAAFHRLEAQRAQGTLVSGRDHHQRHRPRLQSGHADPVGGRHRHLGQPRRVPSAAFGACHSRHRWRAHAAAHPADPHHPDRQPGELGQRDRGHGRRRAQRAWHGQAHRPWHRL